MIGELNHIAVVVADLETAADQFQRLLGAKLVERSFLQESQTDVVILDVNGLQLELLNSKDEQSKVGRILKEKGEGIHHISFHVSEIEAELQRLRGEGVHLLDERPRPGLHGRKIAFLDAKSTCGVLIELAEEPGCASAKE